MCASEVSLYAFVREKFTRSVYLITSLAPMVVGVGGGGESRFTPVYLKLPPYLIWSVLFEGHSGYRVDWVETWLIETFYWVSRVLLSEIPYHTIPYHTILRPAMQIIIQWIWLDDDNQLVEIYGISKFILANQSLHGKKICRSLQVFYVICVSEDKLANHLIPFFPVQGK